MICWHKWEKWKVVGAGDVREAWDELTCKPLPEDQRYVTGHFEVQRRECEKCGKSQLREVQS
jgi:hypothetical protein